MQPTFLPAPTFNVTGFDSEYLPLAYLTPDGKLLKIEWAATVVTYHLPETFNCVMFKNLASAYHAAYGRDLDD